MSKELDRLKLQQTYAYNSSMDKKEDMTVSKLIREPYKSELSYFKQNPKVSGMATEDKKIILNPYSTLKDEEKKAVAINEFIRLKLRENPNLSKGMPISQEQKNIYKQYANAKDQDIKDTVISRILSGDSSANATPEQIEYADRIKTQLNIKW